MKDNKLIAEFMELPTEVFKSGIMNYHHDGAWYEEHELSYNTSWDWLMPVVQKCFEVAKHEDDFFAISGSLPYMDSTYDAVVEFIKQYNDDK